MKGQILPLPRVQNSRTQQTHRAHRHVVIFQRIKRNIDFYAFALLFNSGDHTKNKHRICLKRIQRTHLAHLGGATAHPGRRESRMQHLYFVF